MTPAEFARHWLGEPWSADGYMEVIGPKGPEQRRCTLVRGESTLPVQEPDYDPETERVERSIDGKTYIIKIQT